MLGFSVADPLYMVPYTEVTRGLEELQEENRKTIIGSWQKP